MWAPEWRLDWQACRELAIKRRKQIEASAVLLAKLEAVARAARSVATWTTRLDELDRDIAALRTAVEDLDGGGS